MHKSSQFYRQHSDLTRGSLALQIKDQIVDSKIALSGAIYTELSDVEGEVNGLVTYDRRVIKVSSKALSAINSDLIAASTRMG